MLRRPDGFTSYHRIAGSVAPANTGLITLNAGLARSHEMGEIATTRQTLIEVEALDVGSWGNRLLISVEDEPSGLAARAQTVALTPPLQVRLTSLTGVEPGTLLEVTNGATGASVLLKARSIDPSNASVTLDPPGLDAGALAALGPIGGPLDVRSLEFRGHRATAPAAGSGRAFAQQPDPCVGNIPPPVDGPSAQPLFPDGHRRRCRTAASGRRKDGRRVGVHSRLGRGAQPRRHGGDPLRPRGLGRPATLGRARARTPRVGRRRRFDRDIRRSDLSGGRRSGAAQSHRTASPAQHSAGQHRVDSRPGQRRAPGGIDRALRADAIPLRRARFGDRRSDAVRRAGAAPGVRYQIRRPVLSVADRTRPAAGQSGADPRLPFAALGPRHGDLSPEPTRSGACTKRRQTKWCAASPGCRVG